MESLPLELKQRVCSYLTPKDLKSLRLTAKVFASAACRNFLPRVFLHNHPASFEEIQDITSHPDLKHSVTTLIVDTSCLRSYPRYDDWARRFVPTPTYRAELEGLEVPGDSPMLVHIKWKAYQDRVLDQRKKSSKNRILNGIALAFQRCPRLKHLIIESGSRNRNDSALSKSFLRVYRNDFPSTTTHTRNQSWPSWDIMTFAISDLLKPIHDAGGSLESLVLLDSRLVCRQDPTFSVTSIFQNLKHLRESGSPVDFLTSVVASAPALESFGTLEAYGGQDDSPLSALINGPPLLKLRACSLRGLSDGDLLVRFLLRQTDSLERLRISGGRYLPDVDWKSVATRVKGKLRNLRRVKLVNIEAGPPTYNTGIRRWSYNYMTEKDILQDHEHELEKGPAQIYDGLWEDYEEMFFSDVTRS